MDDQVTDDTTPPVAPVAPTEGAAPDRDAPDPAPPSPTSLADRIAADRADRGAPTGERPSGEAARGVTSGLGRVLPGAARSAATSVAAGAAVSLGSGALADATSHDDAPDHPDGTTPPEATAVAGHGDPGPDALPSGASGEGSHLGVDPFGLGAATITHRDGVPSHAGGRATPDHAPAGRHAAPDGRTDSPPGPTSPGPTEAGTPHGPTASQHDVSPAPSSGVPHHTIDPSTMPSPASAGTDPAAHHTIDPSTMPPGPDGGAVAHHAMTDPAAPPAGAGFAVGEGDYMPGPSSGGGSDGPEDPEDRGISIENATMPGEGEGEGEGEGAPGTEEMSGPGTDERIDDGIHRGPTGIDLGRSVGVDLGFDDDGDHSVVHAGAHGGVHLSPDATRVEGEVDTPSGAFGGSISFDGEVPDAISLDAFGQHVEIRPDQIEDAADDALHEHLPDVDVHDPLDLPEPADLPGASWGGQHADVLDDSSDLHAEDPGIDESMYDPATEPDDPDDA